jgi:transposase
VVAPSATSGKVPALRPCTESVRWLHRHARVSKRLAEFVGLWCENLPVAHVWKRTGLHWETVRGIEGLHLERRLAGLPPAQPARLVMKEFALFRGHRYATVVLDAGTIQVLLVVEGRSRADSRYFFRMAWQGALRPDRSDRYDRSTALTLMCRLIADT